MRIGIDARMLDNKMTGIGRYTKNLIQHLLSRDFENQYILILNKDYLELNLKKTCNLKFIKVNSSPLSLYTLCWLHRIIKKEKIDLFHSPFFLAPLWALCPVIVTVHDLMGLRFPGFFEGRKPIAKLFARWFVRLFVPLTLRRASKIIAVSETTKSDLVEYLNLPEDKIKVIYEGVESCFRKGLDLQLVEKVRRDFHITKRIILYIGNTRPYKNLPRLIRAFKILQDYENCQLVLGSGDTRNIDSLKKMVTQLNLEQKVIFTGPLEDKDIIDLMNVAEVFVFPSLWEGFGLPPLEAMACGVPVVASKAGSLPEILGDAALLVNPESEEEIAKEIMHVLTDKKLREELIKRGFERVKKFTWGKTAGKTQKLFQEFGAESKPIDYNR